MPAAIAYGRALLRRAGVPFERLREDPVGGEDRARGLVLEATAAIGAGLVGVSELVCVEVAVLGGGVVTGLPGFVEAVAFPRQADDDRRRSGRRRG